MGALATLRPKKVVRFSSPLTSTAGPCSLCKPGTVPKEGVGGGRTISWCLDGAKEWNSPFSKQDVSRDSSYVLRGLSKSEIVEAQNLIRENLESSQLQWLKNRGHVSSRFREAKVEKRSKQELGGNKYFDLKPNGWLVKDHFSRPSNCNAWIRLHFPSAWWCIRRLEFLKKIPPSRREKWRKLGLCSVEEADGCSCSACVKYEVTWVRGAVGLKTREHLSQYEEDLVSSDNIQGVRLDSSVDCEVGSGGLCGQAKPYATDGSRLDGCGSLCQEPSSSFNSNFVSPVPPVDFCVDPGSFGQGGKVDTSFQLEFLLPKILFGSLDSNSLNVDSYLLSRPLPWSFSSHSSLSRPSVRLSPSPVLPPPMDYYGHFNFFDKHREPLFDLEEFPAIFISSNSANYHKALAKAVSYVTAVKHSGDISWTRDIKPFVRKLVPFHSDWDLLFHSSQALSFKLPLNCPLRDFIFDGTEHCY